MKKGKKNIPKTLGLAAIDTLFSDSSGHLAVLRRKAIGTKPSAGYLPMPGSPLTIDSLIS